MPGKRIMLLAATLAFTALQPVSSADAGNTDQGLVIENAYAAVSAGDIAAAVEFLTDDAMFSVVPVSSRMKAPALVGKEEIGAWWSGTHQDGGRVEFANLVTDGNRLIFTCLYHGNKLAKLGVSPAEFDGVAILREGKIRVLVWSYTAEYEPKLRSALAKFQK